jgi:hypothetical protein
MNDLGGPKGWRVVMAIAECSLAELMEDPLVGLVMQSDGVDRSELELLFERVGRCCDVRHSNLGSLPRQSEMETAPC